jgi:hypothetical protein
MNPALGYGFWYSDLLETVESAPAAPSANLYNGKSLKPHLNE